MKHILIVSQLMQMLCWCRLFHSWWPFFLPFTIYHQFYNFSPGSWWRHQMETFSALLSLCAGNSPVNSPQKASDAERWCVLWSAPEKNGWVNNDEAGDWRLHHAHYDVTVMVTALPLHESCEPSSLIIKTVFPCKGFSCWLFRSSNWLCQHKM